MSFWLICFAGCQNKSDIERKLPEIIFICSTDYSQIRSERETQYVITFIDKNGNKYVTSDPTVARLGFKELIAKYSQGGLDDKIELLTSYDNFLIEENYKKFKEVALNEDVSIQYPELYKSENLSVLGHSHDLLKMYLHRLVHEIHSKDLW